MIYGIIREDYDGDSMRYVPNLDEFYIFEHKWQRELAMEQHFAPLSGVLVRYTRFKCPFFDGAYQRQRGSREDNIDTDE